MKPLGSGELNSILEAIGPFKWAVLVSLLVVVSGLSIGLYTAVTGLYPKADVAGGEYATVYSVGQRLFPVTIPSTQGTVSVPIEGKVNIIVPQYVRCPDICHYETLIMKSLMIKLFQENSLDDVVFVTVEVDPWRGSLEEADMYIKESTASLGFTPPWIWVGGNMEPLETLYKQLGLSVQLDSSTGLIVHTAGFYIVDRNGILLYYVKVEDEGWKNPGKVADVLEYVVNDALSK